jgi:predicted Zn-dependent protease
MSLLESDNEQILNPAMQARFFELVEQLGQGLQGGEVLLCNLSAERSDFVRFNRGRVRQAGSVEQRVLTLRLVRNRRQAALSLAISGHAGEQDAPRAALQQLRDALEGLPEDPWLLINETPQSTSSVRRGKLAPAEAVVEQAVRAAGGRDLVGIYAGGTQCRGFANSLGQRNWHEIDSFNFDWSVYRQGDQAVKSGYAGFDWDPATLQQKAAAAAQQEQLLGLQRKNLAPGEYRAYLSPKALDDIIGLLSWGGFSARARATKQSPLLRMQEGRCLSDRITLMENTRDGVAPPFQGEGFVKPASVTLIHAGKLGDALVSPRSAREYGLATNAANGAEMPQSVDLSPGTLEDRHVLEALDTGLFVSNLWYLNYSDRPAGRITGMTRFATFWVEGGRIVAPVTPMRFDDSVYRMLGENLVDMTAEREMLLDPSTYGERSSSSARLPGALLSSLRFTL